jgi:hypothetical protein
MAQCWFRKRIGESIYQCPNDGIYGLPPDTPIKPPYTAWAIKSRWCKLHKHRDDVLITDLPFDQSVDSPPQSPS